MAARGFGPGENSRLQEDDILALSNDATMRIPITIAGAARDEANTGNTTYLRKGLVLAKITLGADAGKYKQFDEASSDGSQNEEDAVILLHDKQLNGTDDDMASAFFAAVIRPTAPIFKDAGAEGAFDWSAVQRLQRLG